MSSEMFRTSILHERVPVSLVPLIIDVLQGTRSLSVSNYITKITNDPEVLHPYLDDWAIFNSGGLLPLRTQGGRLVVLHCK